MKNEVLQFLSDSLGLEDGELPEFYDSFMSSFASCVDGLKALSSPGDFASIRAITHTLFGFSQNVGANDLFEISTLLNMAAKAEDKELCALHIDGLVKLFDAYRQEA